MPTFPFIFLQYTEIPVDNNIQNQIFCMFYIFLSSKIKLTTPLFYNIITITFQEDKRGDYWDWMGWTIIIPWKGWGIEGCRELSHIRMGTNAGIFNRGGIGDVRYSLSITRFWCIKYSLVYGCISTIFQPLYLWNRL